LIIVYRFVLISVGHCIVCSSIYCFWLLLWYVVAIVSSAHRFIVSDYSFGMLWPLYRLLIDLLFLITPLVCCGHCIVCSSIYCFWLLLWYVVAIVLSALRFIVSDYSFDMLWPLYCMLIDLLFLITPLVCCGHCIVCSSIYCFWLLLWYVLALLSIYVYLLFVYRWSSQE
jgi:hypothetical protein